MTESEAFDRDAFEIGKLMQKHNSIGTIMDSKGNCRLFCNGDSGAIVGGLVLAVAHLCEVLDDDTIIDEIANRAADVLAKRRGCATQ